jgi:Tol biopolymer transport system component
VGADKEILIMNADGTDQRVLADGETPAWSPDGEWIAFAVLGDGIFVMRSDGSEKKRLTDSSGNTYDWYPVWSPDGSEILFASNRHQPDWAAYEAVYVMNRDGSGIGQLTSPWSIPPYSWSPDGVSIVYAHYGSDGPELYRVDANGVESEPLMPDNAGVHPQWRP